MSWHTALADLRNTALFFAAWLGLGGVSVLVIRLALRRGDDR